MFFQNDQQIGTPAPVIGGEISGDFNNFRPDALQVGDVGNTGGFFGGGGAGGFDWGGTAKGFGSLAGGIGGLAQAWQGMQGLKLAKKSMAQQQENWDKNYEAQRADIAHNRGQRAAARSRQGSGYVVK